MSTESVKKYITIKELGVSPSGKTKVWGVYSTADQQIGIIRWKGGWRKYVYYTSDSFYDWDCLRLIADFIQTATKDHIVHG